MTHGPGAISTGVIRAIAHRPIDGDPMIEATQCRVVIGRGLDTENRKRGQREVTLLSFESWTDVCRELGADVAWHARRANFLVEGINLAAAIGKIVSIGEVRLQIHGETKPCHIMDEQNAGLRQALVPEFRGGVFGQVLAGGTIRVGDRIFLASDSV